MLVLMEQFWGWGQGRRADAQTGHEDRLQLAGLRAVCTGCALSLLVPELYCVPLEAGDKDKVRC